MSSLGGFKKVAQTLAKVSILAIFDYLGPPNANFPNVQLKFKKNHLSQKVIRVIVLKFKPSISSGLRRG